LITVYLVPLCVLEALWQEKEYRKGTEA